MDTQVVGHGRMGPGNPIQPRSRGVMQRPQQLQKRHGPPDCPCLRAMGQPLYEPLTPLTQMLTNHTRFHCFTGA